MKDLIILTIGSVLIWGLFLLPVFLWRKGKKEMAIHATVACVIAWIVAHLIKEVIYYPRPYLNNGKEAIAIHVPESGAFPSGHTAAAVALAVSIWLHDGKLGRAALAAGIAIGIARVLANIHYPVDVIGGVILGTVTALMVNQVHLRVENLVKEKKK